MLTQNIKKTLMPARPLRYLDEHELDELISYCRLVDYKKDENLLYQGKRGEGMYILMQGHAQITAIVLGSEMLSLASLNPGDFIGEVSLIHKGPNAISVIAKTDLQCLLISSAYFDMLSIFFSEIKYKISKAITEDICDRLKILHEKTVSLIANTEMITQSIFAEVVRSMHKPEIVDYASMNLDLAQLKNSEFFNHFDETEFTQLLKHTVLLKAAKNCVLIKENENETACYVILRGAVQLTMSHKGKVVKWAVLGPMEIFGSASLIKETPSLITYTTCERALLLKISSENLNALKKNHINIWYKLFDSICKSFVLLEQSGEKLLIRLNSELYNR